MHVCIESRHLSVLSLSLRRNLSLSSSTTLSTLSIRFFLSCTSRLSISTCSYPTFPSSKTCFSIPFLRRSYVGSLSMAAHFSSSSSSSLPLFWNTSVWLFHASLILAEAQPRWLPEGAKLILRLIDLLLIDRLLIDLARSSPASADAIPNASLFLLQHYQNKKHMKDRREGSLDLE